MKKEKIVSYIFWDNIEDSEPIAVTCVMIEDKTKGLSIVALEKFKSGKLKYNEGDVVCCIALPFKRLSKYLKGFWFDLVKQAKTGDVFHLYSGVQSDNINDICPFSK